MTYKGFRGLNRKLAVSVLASALCFAVVAIAVIFALVLTRAQVKENTMINQLLDTVEYSSAIATYTNNQQIAEDVAQGLLRNDIVHKVKINGDQGLAIEKQKSSNVINATEVTRKLFAPFDNSRVIGSIAVTSQAEYSLDEAKNSALVNALNSLALIVLTTLIILFVVNRNIVQPLTLVSNALHAISAGERRRILVSTKNKDDELGRLTLDINQLLDTLEKKFTNERTLREKIQVIERQLRNIFESTSAGLFLLDQDGKLITYNPTMLRILSGSSSIDEDITNKEFAGLFFKDPAQVTTMLTDALQTEGLKAQDLVLRQHFNEESKMVHCLVSKTYDDESGMTRLEGVVFDVTKRIAEENEMRQQAEYDTLTGALRRGVAENKLATLLADPRKQPIVVMVLDLDGFKAVNDTYGHDAGDEVLVEVTTRFIKNVRAGDIIARLGGDEFLIVLTRCEPINAELDVAEKIIKTIQQPIMLKSQTFVSIGISIGMASSVCVEPHVVSLIKAADEAMYAVKRQGKNGFAIKNSNHENIAIKLFPKIIVNGLSI